MIVNWRKRYPNSERLIDAQAMCLIHLNEREGAKRMLEEHRQGNPHIQKRLGRLYQSLGDFRKAVEYLLEANRTYQEKYGVDESKHCRFGYRCLGDSYAEMQQFASAYFCYERSGSNSKRAFLHKKIAECEEKKHNQSPQEYVRSKRKPLFPVFGKSH